jgi:hypothetical protein
MKTRDFRVSVVCNAILFAVMTVVQAPAANIAALLGGSPPTEAPSGPTYLVKQDYEGTGYDNSETWTEAGTGTKDEDYATSPAPLVGSQSLRLALSSQNGTTQCNLSTSAGTCDAYFVVHFVSLPANGKIWFRLRNSSNTMICYVMMNTSNRITVGSGTGTAITTNSISAGTTYHFWVSYSKDADGGSASGTASVAFSTDGVRPLSGNAYAATAVGSQTTDVHHVIIGPENNSTWEGIFDRVRVDDATIGDNPT